MCFWTTSSYQRSKRSLHSLLSTRAASTHGISTIEFSFIAPILFAIVFAVIYFGQVYSARVSLSTAVGAVRTGFARGDLSVVLPGLATIPDIANFKSSPGNPHVPPAHLADLLASTDQNGVAPGKAFGANGIYATMLADTYGGSPAPALKDLSETKLYTLVFISQMMAQSIGPSLRYPCEERGCLYCKFLPDPGTPGDPSTRYTGVECSYRPSSMFLDPVLSLLSLMTGGLVDSDITLTRRRVFDP